MYPLTVSWYWGQDLNQEPLNKKQNTFYREKVKRLDMYVTDTHHSDIHSVILCYGNFVISTEFIDKHTIVQSVKCCLLLALLFRNMFFSISAIQNYFFLEARLAEVCCMVFQDAFYYLCVAFSCEA